MTTSMASLGSLAYNTIRHRHQKSLSNFNPRLNPVQHQVNPQPVKVNLPVQRRHPVQMAGGAAWLLLQRAQQ